MVKGHGKDLSDMRVIQGVVDHPSLLAAPDDPVTTTITSITTTIAAVTTTITSITTTIAAVTTTTTITVMTPSGISPMHTAPMPAMAIRKLSPKTSSLLRP